MSFPESLGYLALLLLVVGFAVKTIVALRALAMGASVALIGYGVFAERYEVAAIGLVMASVNLWRLMEMRRLVGAVRSAIGSPLTVDWLLPYMRPVDIPAGHVLFTKGDKADAMYFVSSGRVRIEGLSHELTKGSIFGEIGIFSEDQRRTATARCVEPCSLLLIDADRVRELYYQNPQFGFYLVGLVTERLMQNARELKLSSAASIV
jgi:CRP/FNR family cyclic AMP-dependent transcriptional regulator